MSQAMFEDLVHYLRQTAEIRRANDLSDAELIERFVSDHEESAFKVLVRRHGPMVLSVCRRTIGDRHLAEDAFQATFLVLAQRAASLTKKELVAGWLYGVAQRVARRARTRLASHRGHQLPKEAPPVDEQEERTTRELCSVLDEEISALPEQDRAAVVLCYFEGKSYDQAARAIGIPKSTLASRLARARETLGRRLTKRGITLSSSALVAALTEQLSSAAVGATLTSSTAKAAVGVVAGKTLATLGLSAQVIALAKTTMKGMFTMKLILTIQVAALGLSVALGLASMAALPDGADRDLTKGINELPAIAPLQQADPAKLFFAMEKKLQAAKSLKVRYDMEMKDGGKDKTAKFNGALYIMVGNKARFEGEMKAEDELKKFVLVSDGKQIGKVATNEPALLPDPTPARFNAYSVGLLARGGGFFAMIWFGQMSDGNAHEDINKTAVISEFKSHGKEKIGKQEAHVVGYVLEMHVAPKVVLKGQMKLWIDDRTMLPLKRTGTLSVEDKDQGQFTETYAEVLLDPELDAKLFELPVTSAKTAVPLDATAKPKFPRDQYGDSLPDLAAARLGTVRWRAGPSSDIVYLPGDVLVTAGSGGFYEMRLFDAKNGQPLRHFLGIAGKAISADGKLLFSDSFQLLDVAQGKKLRQFKLGAGAGRHAVALSADGKIAAAGQADGKLAAAGQAQDGSDIVLWDTASGKLLHRLVGHKEGVRALAFSSDGKFLASGGDDKVIRIWDVAAGKELRQINEHQSFVRCLAYDPMGKHLASSSEDGMVRLWDVQTSKLTHQVKVGKAKERNVLPQYPSDGRFCVVFSSDGKVLASVADQGEICLWDVASAKELRRWIAHKGEISSIAFAPDDKLLVSVGVVDGTIRRWDAETGNQIEPPSGHTSQIKLLQYSADGKTLWSTASDQKALEWNADTRQIRRSLFDGSIAQSKQASWQPLCVSSDGKTMAATQMQGEAAVVHLWDNTAAKAIRTLGDNKGIRAPGRTEIHGKFSPDGKFLAAGVYNRLHVWEVGTGKELQQMDGVRGFEFSADSRCLYLTSGNGSLRLWEVATGKELRQWTCPAEIGMAFVVSADGKWMATTDYQNVVVWATETGKEVVRFGVNVRSKPEFLLPRCLAFSPSGRVLAIGGGGGNAFANIEDEEPNTGAFQLWDIHTGKKIGQIVGPQGMVFSLAFNPDGRTIASGGQDSTILLWDLGARARGGKSNAEPLTTKELDLLWTDLANDAAKADKAIWTLVSAPKESMALLKDRLKPVTPADAKMIGQLIADLESPQFAVRQKATEALDKIGEPAEAQLRKAVLGKVTLELRQRAEQILNKRNEDPEIIRRLRGIEALELIGTSDARLMLSVLSLDAPSPRIVEAAKSALRRIEAINGN